MHRLNRAIPIFLTILWIALCVTTAQASLNAESRKQLEGYQSLQALALQRITDQTNAERLRTLTAEILQLEPAENLAIGARRTYDEQGRAAIHRFITQRAGALPGVQVMSPLRGKIVVPTPTGNAPADQEDPGGPTISIGDQTIPIYALWPNGPMPSLAPKDGLTGELVDAGDAEWGDLAAKQLDGKIALMNFRGGRNFERLFSLGVKAVVVIADDHVVRENAERLFTTTPIPVPRYYVDAEKGERLRQAAGKSATLRGGHTFAARSWLSPVAYLPPTEPVSYTVAENDLLERYALQYGTSAAEMLASSQNKAEFGADPIASLGGGSLFVPTRADDPVTVAGNELFTRIAIEFGLTPAELMEANPAYAKQVAEINDLADAEAVVEALEAGGKTAELDLPLEAGKVLTIPNLNETVVVTVPIDSVSVAPDAPHGAKVAVNIAATLLTLEHLATSPDIVRRKGMLFFFMDGENHGGLTSRKFAEFVAGEAAAVEQGGGFGGAIAGAIIGFVIAGLVGGFIGFLGSRPGVDEDQDVPMSRRRNTAIFTGLAIGGVGAVILGFPMALAASAGPQDYQRVPVSWYEAADAVWRGEADATLSSEQSRWFVEHWLASRIEKVRVQMAEERGEVSKAYGQTRKEINRAKQVRRARERDREIDYRRDGIDVILKEMGDEAIDQLIAEKQQRLDTLDAKIDRIEDRLEIVVELRSETVESGDPAVTVVKQFQEFLNEDPERTKQIGLTNAQVYRRLTAEMVEERRLADLDDHNKQAIDAIMELLPSDGKGESQPVIGWYLDISSGTQTLGVKAGPDFRVKMAGANLTRQYGTRYRDVLEFASGQAGWEEEWVFLTEEDRVERPIMPIEPPPVYAEFWTTADVTVLPLGTINDRQEHLDTPRDTLETIDPTGWENLSVQTRNAMFLLRLGLESPLDSLAPTNVNRTEVARVTGRALRFNARSGIDAQEPVAGVLMMLPGIPSKGGKSTHNPQVHIGSRRPLYRLTMLSGSYIMPVEAVSYGTAKKSVANIYGYRLDPDQAVFDMVIDEGQIGTKTQSTKFQLTGGVGEVELNLVFTDAYPRVFFPGPDPMDYEPIGDDKIVVNIQDATIDGEPQHYAFDNPLQKFKERDVTSNIVYMPTDRDVRMVAKRNVTYKMLLVGPLADQDGDGEVSTREAKGIGYSIGPEFDEVSGEQIDRNLTMPLTEYLIARDMVAVARYRISVLESKGIRVKSVIDAVDEAEARIEAARQIIESDDPDWQAAIGQSREAWGIMVKFLPRILTIGRQAVFSAVVLMALLVPASMFLERLVIGSKSILARLGGIVAIFVLGCVFLNFFHPAFQISVSPFIVMIAFTMILMATIVLVISYQKFEVLVRRARSRAGEVEGDKISLTASLATALSLGVSNLKKRPARTLLTSFTVTVLTFSIITFVSVKGVDALYVRDIPLDATVEGMTEPVDPVPPQFEGVVFRNFMWMPLSQGFSSAIQTEFGTDYEMTTRGFYIQTAGGNNMAREGVNQIPVRKGGKASIVTAIMTFMPNEPRFSALNEAVTNEQWFRSAEQRSDGVEDRYRIILPDTVAEELGITPEMIYEGDAEAIASGQAELKPDEELPRVLMQNSLWRVIGILDTQQADLIRDATGKSLAIVDHKRSAFAESIGEEPLVNEPPSFHRSWRHLVIVPHAAMSDVGAKPRSVALRFDSPDEAEAFSESVALRLNRAVFGSRSGDVSLITTQNKQSIGGLAKIIVPVVLCILIVLNTMLGNVEERKGEVGMLGAVGLSPSQISFLLLSESAVFSVLGIIFGTFTGLAFGFVVFAINKNIDPTFLNSLSFNFASLASMGLAMGTGIVVLLATLIPARKASAMAAPSGMERWELPEPKADNSIDFVLPFTLTRGNAVGMTAFFRRFLLNHTDAASADFNCRDIVIGIEPESGALQLTTTMWLAPYDLDVAQDLKMLVVPTENEGVFAVRLRLQRTSGTEEAWLRTNYGFMDLVRHQFLLWRNLDEDARTRYIDEGADLFRQEAGK